MKATATLTDEDRLRYRQQILLPDIGVEGQQKLKNARVAIVGLGGLGSPVALYLTATGVGSLTLIEYDSVSLSNLHRQILYDSESVGRSKLAEASKRISLLNPEISLVCNALRLDGNAVNVLSGHDLIIDCTDNFESRYAINSASIELGIPVVFGSVHRFSGQVSVFGAKGGPCYCCLYPIAPEDAVSCSDDGVLGTVPGLVGILQATEALKLILGIGEPLVGKFLLYDALLVEFRTIKVIRDPNCPTCGDQKASSPAKSVASAIRPRGLSVEEYAEWLREEKRHQLIDIREEYERDIASIGGELIPMAELTGRLNGLVNDEPIVVYCHLGIRSRQVATMLAQMGYRNVYDLLGGIDRWSERIDSKVPRY